MKEIKDKIDEIKKELGNRYGPDKVSLQFLICDLQDLCEDFKSGTLKRQLDDLYNAAETDDEKLSDDDKDVVENDLAAVEETLKLLERD